MAEHALYILIFNPNRPDIIADALRAANIQAIVEQVTKDIQ